jgi:hypothetical protein
MLAKNFVRYKLGEYVTSVGWMRNAYRAIVGKPHGECLLGRVIRGRKIT